MRTAQVLLFLAFSGPTAATGALGIAWACELRPAPSARFIPASIAIDGREILRGSTSDDGHPDVDAVWGYLRGIAFTPTEELAKLGLATDAAELLLEKKGEPKAIVLDLAYGGEARTWRLALERSQNEKGEVRWKLAPAEIERLFPYRLISRADAARLREPKRAR
jgi:hypothetical protein